MVLVSARFASKRGGCPKAVLVSSGGAQNCASKLRVTILLRDPLTIPACDQVGVGFILASCETAGKIPSDTFPEVR